MSVNAGNGRGIDLDPISVPTNHIVYLGADCDPAMRPTAVACTLWDYDMTVGSTKAFARFHRTATETFESLYFAPDGSSAFVSYRDSGASTQGLAVISRPAALIASRNVIDDSQLVRRITMSAMPQGVAFRAAGDFAVTLNENGTMTRLDVPDGELQRCAGAIVVRVRRIPRRTPARGRRWMYLRAAGPNGRRHERCALQRQRRRVLRQHRSGLRRFRARAWRRGRCVESRAWQHLGFDVRRLESQRSQGRG